MGPVNSSPTTFKFLKEFDSVGNLNGLQMKNVYVPVEVITIIFTYLGASDILNCSAVCKCWFNIAKSNALWHKIYNQREAPKKAKQLPWYVFYSYFTTNNFKNLIENGNGQEEYKYWTILLNGGEKFRIEQIPEGSDQLPEGVPEFKGHESCFATSFEASSKYQGFNLKGKRLLKYIIKKYKPTLYASEWFAGRFDCGCIYKLIVICNTNSLQRKPIAVRDTVSFVYAASSTIRSDPEAYSLSKEKKIEQWQGSAWEKVEISDNNYPDDVEKIFFCHEGRDTQFWRGHYGSKMAGGVLRFDFNSISPTDDDLGYVCQNQEDLSN